MSEDRITKLEDQLDKIHSALLGDMDDQPGTIHLVRDMSARLQRMETKVERLETDSIRAKGFIASVGGIIGAGGAYFLDKITKP